MQDNNFFKHLILSGVSGVSETQAEQVALLLTKEGYLDIMENRRFEIFNYYHETIKFYMGEGDNEDDAKMKARVDACDIYQIDRATLWRIQKRFNSCKPLQHETNQKFS